MINEEEMRRKFTAIAARYLARTAAEIGDLQKLVAQLNDDGKVAPKTTLKEIEILAHRIRGSGAVFGFAKLSDAAGAIEMLAVDSELADRDDAASLMRQFNVHIEHLAAEAQHALSVAPKN